MHVPIFDYVMLRTEQTSIERRFFPSGVIELNSLFFENNTGRMAVYLFPSSPSCGEKGWRV